MEAAVTLKATPQEFDLLRAALDSHVRVQEAIIANDDSAPASVRIARARIVQTNDLRRKMGGK